MPPVMRWTLRLFAGVVIAGTSALGTAIWIADHQYDKPAVPLTAGLHGEWTALAQELGKRVKARFPLGSPTASMSADLRGQGFSREDWGCSAARQHEAVRREDNIVCQQAARIYWNADSEGRLTAVRGIYRPEGCL